MKPVSLLCYMFLWTWRCTTFNSTPSILILLTNKIIPLIYSITICQQKTKDCAPSGSFQHKLLHRFFLYFMFVVFYNQSPLITMSKRSQVLNLSCENEFYLHQNEWSFSYQSSHLHSLQNRVGQRPRATQIFLTCNHVTSWPCWWSRQ